MHSKGIASIVPCGGPPDTSTGSEAYCATMVNLEHVAQLVIRQATSTTPATAVTTAPSTTGGCEAGNGYDGRIGLRVSAIFVILVGSLFGTRGCIFGDNTDLTIDRCGFSSLCKST